MAGLILAGFPILGGLVGGTVLQAAMRGVEWSLGRRVGAELALMGVGALVVYVFPPGSAARGENWGKFMLAGSMFCSGSFAMAEGAIVNIVLTLGAATTLKALGVLLVACVAFAVHREKERRERRSDETPLWHAGVREPGEGLR
jgi:hypothetical protein